MQKKYFKDVDYTDAYIHVIILKSKRVILIT